MLFHILSLVFIFFFITIISSTVIAQNVSNTLLDRANLLFDSGKYRDVIIYYDKILEIHPNNMTSIYNKALSLSYIGNFSDSIRVYDRILDIQPNSTDVLKEKADNLAQMERYEDAIKLYDQVLEINPDDVYVSSMKRVTEDALSIDKQLGNK